LTFATCLDSHTEHAMHRSKTTHQRYTHSAWAAKPTQGRPRAAGYRRGLPLAFAAVHPPSSATSAPAGTVEASESCVLRVMAVSAVAPEATDSASQRASGTPRPGSAATKADNEAAMALCRASKPVASSAGNAMPSCP